MIDCTYEPIFIKIWLADVFWLCLNPLIRCHDQAKKIAPSKPGAIVFYSRCLRDQPFRSYRSAFITLTQAATKS